VTRAVALTALITLLLAGCGGGADGDTGAESAIDLKLTLWPNGEAGDSTMWTLRCDPPGGDHPDPEAACAALAAVADPFGPVAPPDRCAEIPGGDEAVAVLDGDYRGREVHSRYTRANACVSGRWDRIAPVFPTGF
jgi:Subtilisin inhibitor-like